jgi:hypothetical protein
MAVWNKWRIFERKKHERDVLRCYEIAAEVQE